VPNSDDRPQFPCICDPTDLFDPPDPRPRVVPGCPAHQVRGVFQRIINEWDDSVEMPAPCQPIGCDNGHHLSGCTYEIADGPDWENGDDDPADGPTSLDTGATRPQPETSGGDAHCGDRSLCVCHGCDITAGHAGDHRSRTGLIWPSAVTAPQPPAAVDRG
jgi:hypothetical protein